MLQDEIQVPVTASGDIDVAYMETYIRAMEKLAIGDVVLWKEKEIETAKKKLLNNVRKGCQIFSHKAYYHLLRD